MRREEFLLRLQASGSANRLTLNNTTLEPEPPGIGGAPDGFDIGSKAVERLVQDEPTKWSWLPRAGQRNGLDLSGAELQDTQADHLRADGACFAQGRLNGSHLAFADFDDANLNGTLFENADLTNATLRRASLANAILSNAVSKGARFDSAVMDGATLSHANLQNACLTGVTCNGTRFDDAELSGSDLSKGEFIGADFSRTQLTFANLNGARFNGVAFAEATMPRASLISALFRNSTLEGVDLRGCEFRDAAFPESSLRGARLSGSNITSADLTGVQWGDAVIGDEAAGEYQEAEALYRSLKQWYMNKGMYEMSGKFAYRENVAARKSLSNTQLSQLLTSHALDQIFGYGEKPLRLLRTWLIVIVGFGIFFWLHGGLTPAGLGSSLYFSAVSFTAVGYGSWVIQADEISRAAGVLETLLGVILLALFVTTFVRRFTR